MIEEEFVQEELFGEFPIIPQWEAVEDVVISEVEEDTGQSDFFKDFDDGFI